MDAAVPGEPGRGRLGTLAGVLGGEKPRAPRAGGNWSRKKTQLFTKLRAKSGGVTLVLQLHEQRPSCGHQVSLTQERLPWESWRPSSAFHGAGK